MILDELLTADEREDLRRAAAFYGRAEAAIGTIERLLALSARLRASPDPALHRHAAPLRDKVSDLIDLMLNCELGKEDE